MDGVLRLVWLLGLLLAVAAFATGQVSRRRLERFAQRQRLTVTPDNGGPIIGYLTTTRRWRTAGVLAGWVVAEATAPLRRGEISTGTDWIMIAVGWFLGAVIAEVRVEHLRHGRIRAASLRPRPPGRYVRPLAWALVPAAAVLALTVAAATAAAGTLGWARPDGVWAAIWVVAALMVAVAVRAIQYAVLRRPQPRAAPDLLAADDAIRARSLHVLSCAGAALVFVMVLNQVGSIHPVGIGDSTVLSIRIFGLLAVGLAGWLVATSMWPPPRSATGPDRPAVGAA